MKILFILVSLFTSFASVKASDLAEYERHYEELNKLRGQLEKLELEKKIQEIRADIKKVKRESSASAISASGSSFQGGFEQPQSASANIASSTKLIYVIGTGKDAKAVIDFGGNSRTVKNNETVDGWKVKITGKKVKLSKGKNTVEL